MPNYLREAEKNTSAQKHSTDSNLDSFTPGNDSITLDQIRNYKFWKENISQYYKFMVVTKEHLKRLDLTLKSMDSAESSKINLAKNIGTTALGSILSTAGTAASGAIGGAIGTAIAGPVGTIVGTGIGMASSTGLNYLSKKAVGKLNDQLGIVHPYPKTRNMILDINNYDKNLITKTIKTETNKDNLKVTAANLLTSQLVGKLSPVKIPVYQLADLAVSHHKASGKLRKDKAEHILDFTKKINEVLDESHSDAVKFMRRAYGDHKMSLTGFSSRIKREKLTLDTMVRTKNKIEIRINSINRQVLKLSSENKGE
ncbi:hypothetical protein [Xenorhabdus miraniensis]|uniref:Uncharacterized protein n=1 Tax=Xenorhabdus miraniensis TaxID=351674 RepID=A0A2D0JSJ7_9GAMM|nr:hypothetical protein [Xenorhabdus miraniensis]PHM49302.1 hypothetical protein Xmir_01658 [Xenorhabdus miraniensis]